MSEIECLFLDVPLGPEDAARVLAEQLDLDLLPATTPGGDPGVWAEELVGAGYAGGTVGAQYWLVEDPEDHTAFEDYPLVWNIRSQHRHPDHQP